MASKLRLSGIVEESIVDGPGLRFVVFTQGCPHHCPGCHNPQTHSFTDGYLEDIQQIYNQYQENPLLSGITFSGGEPFCQPEPLAKLGRMIHQTGGHIITYTGYVYEELLRMSQSNPAIRDLLEVTDQLIDGPYIQSLRDLTLPFRGSSNQRIITLPHKKE
ncbi:MAG: anaerobic ribonucleoside-triphosphate reductase activating protein [Anaerobutyricum sp.]|nr:anaerobic ribonucleoside-triphosphate reductase activating protein [Anaerobutyricum sp.]